MTRDTGKVADLRKVMMIDKMLDHLTESAGVVEPDVIESFDETADGDHRTLQGAELPFDRLGHAVDVVSFRIENDTVELIQIKIVEDLGLVIFGESVGGTELSVGVKDDKIYVVFFRGNAEDSAQAALESAGKTASE